MPTWRKCTDILVIKLPFVCDLSGKPQHWKHRLIPDDSLVVGDENNLWLGERRRWTHCPVIALTNDATDIRSHVLQNLFLCIAILKIFWVCALFAHVTCAHRTWRWTQLFL